MVLSWPDKRYSHAIGVFPFNENAPFNKYVWPCYHVCTPLLLCLYAPFTNSARPYYHVCMLLSPYLHGPIITSAWPYYRVCMALPSSLHGSATHSAWPFHYVCSPFLKRKYAVNPVFVSLRRASSRWSSYPVAAVEILTSSIRGQSLATLFSRLSSVDDYRPRRVYLCRMMERASHAVLLTFSIPCPTVLVVREFLHGERVESL